MDGSHFERRFDTYREHADAIRRLLETSRGQLSVFDPDLSHCELESAQCAGLLERLLLNKGARLRVVLHDTTILESRRPRLMRMLGQFSHCFEVRQSPDDLRNLTECYLLSEPDDGVVRFHRDWARGKWFVDNPDEATVWRNRFTQLWECSVPAVSATRLGL
ncbi:MAG: hypothetical protein E6R14_11310 [Thermomicrobiales bacterium]|nr:MAG: hypothetical protein E6R14_11310 [Thermomicrobiales bacterium]